jgi:hypothetical protein
MREIFRLLLHNFLTFYEWGSKLYDVLLNIWQYYLGKDYALPNISLLGRINYYSQLNKKLLEDSRASVINQSKH